MDFGFGDIAWALSAWNITKAVLAFADKHIAAVIVLALVVGLVVLHKAPGAFKLNKLASLGLVAVALIALIFEGLSMIFAPAPLPTQSGGHPSAASRGSPESGAEPVESLYGGQ